jgi:hypothetical protein
MLIKQNYIKMHTANVTECEVWTVYVISDNTGKVSVVKDRLCGLVVSVADYKHRVPGHSLGFF